VFIEEVVKTGNGTRAALKAYDTDDYNTAKAIASENLSKPYIEAEINKRLQDAKNMIYTLAMSAEKDEVKLRASQDIVDRVE
jgi:phage terminase small subunit